MRRQYTTLPQYALVVYREGHQTFNLEGGVQFSARVPMTETELQVIKWLLLTAIVMLAPLFKKDKFWKFWERIFFMLWVIGTITLALSSIG